MPALPEVLPWLWEQIKVYLVVTPPGPALQEPRIAPHTLMLKGWDEGGRGAGLSQGCCLPSGEGFLGFWLDTEPGTAMSKENPQISHQAHPLLLRFPENLHFFLETFTACRKKRAKCHFLFDRCLG